MYYAERMRRGVVLSAAIVATIAVIVGFVVGIAGGYFWGLSAVPAPVTVTTTKTVTAPGAAKTVTATSTVTATKTVTAPAAAPLAGKVIKVGVVQPLSGPLAYFGESGLDGVKFATDEINAKGGVLGAKIELHIEDFGIDYKAAAAAAEKLITVDKVNVVVGGFASGAGYTIEDVTEKYHVPYVTIGCSADTITARGYHWVFRTAPNSTEYMLMMGHVLSMLYPKAKRVAILAENSEYGQASLRAIKKLAPQYGWTIVYDEPYEKRTPDFRPTLQKVKATNPDLIGLVSYLTDAALIMKQSKEVGINVPISTISGAGPQTLKFIDLTGKGAEGMVMASEFWPNKKWPYLPAVMDISYKFWDKYKRPIDFQAWAGIGVMYIIKDAVTRAKSLDHTDLRNAIASTNMFLPWMGPILFYPNGHAGWWKYNLVTYQIQKVRQVDGIPANIPWQSNGLSFYAVYPPKAAVAALTTP